MAIPDAALRMQLRKHIFNFASKWWSPVGQYMQPVAGFLFWPISGLGQFWPHPRIFSPYLLMIAVQLLITKH